MCHLHVVCCLILYDSPFYSLLSIFSLIFLFILLIIFIFHVGDKNPPTLANEESGTIAENNPLTGYEPNDLHISETTDIFIQESSSDNRYWNSHDLDLDDYTIGRALSSPLFTQEREDPASRRRAYHSPDEGLSSSQSSSVGHVRTGRPVSDQFDSLIPNVRENPRRSTENEQIRHLLERQRQQILADCEAEIQKDEFQAGYDRRSIQKLNGVIESQRGEIYRAHQGDEQHRRDQQLLRKPRSKELKHMWLGDVVSLARVRSKWLVQVAL